MWSRAPSTGEFTVVAVLAAVAVLVAACSEQSGPTGASSSAPATVTVQSVAAPVTTTLSPQTTPIPQPAMPTPSPGPAPVYATAANPIGTGGGLPRVACSLPAWPDNETDLVRFFEVAVGCLDRAWQPVLAQRELPFAPAKVALTGQLPGSPAQACGRPPEDHSYYCDGTIYLSPASFLGTGAGPLGVPAAAIGLVAHEYGHHVQRLAGLLPEAVLEINVAGAGSDPGLELSRRVELQAQCFAGMFVGVTFDPAGVELAKRDNYTRGDLPGRPADHGSPQNFGGWFAKGVQDNSLTTCNAWRSAATGVR